jgi:hypothetical protein
MTDNNYPSVVKKECEVLWRESVWEALRIEQIDQIDLYNIRNLAERISPEDRGRAEQVVETREFKQWMLSDKRWVYSGSEWVFDDEDFHLTWRTMKLLVHGDSNSNDNVSSLSVLCASLKKVLSTRRRFISLVFFCGRHLHGDKNPGPLAMIRSLVGQLLEQNPAYSAGVAQQVSMPDVERGNIPALCDLFRFLIGQLPSTITVFCMIDGVGLYEEEQYWDDMETILSFIQAFVEDEGIHAPVKLFLTSPQPTRYVWRTFQDGKSLLTMASVPDFAQGPSSTRFNRHVNDVV